MKNYIKILFLSLSFSYTVQAQNEVHKLTVPLSEPGKPYSLELGMVNGSIKVTGYEGKDILIEASNKNTNTNKNKTETKDGMRRINTEESIELTAEEKNNKVEISTPGWARATQISIKIPSGASKLELHTINNGDIIVENVKSEMEISNINGKITLTNISGSVVASTINGGILVNLNSVNPNAPMAFTTLNGSVDVTFPASFKGNMKLKSDRGEIFTDFEMNVEKSSSNVNKSNKPGLYKIEIEDWVTGKINGGGPEVMMKNMHGNIYVRKAK